MCIVARSWISHSQNQLLRPIRPRLSRSDSNHVLVHRAAVMGSEMTPEELMRKIIQMERDHARLMQEMAMLIVEQEEKVSGRPRFDNEKLLISPLLRRKECGGRGAITIGCEVPEVLRFTDLQCLNILESMGQSVHIFDIDNRIIYWNKAAHRMYGHTKDEAIGQNVVELLVGVKDLFSASVVIDKVYTGESWTGQFPVINKKGEKILAVATNSPLYDDRGTLVGQISVTCDSRPFHDVLVVSARPEGSKQESGFGRFRHITASNPGLDPQQPLQVGIRSKLSNLASKVGSDLRLRMNIGNDADWAGGMDGRLNFIHSLLDKKLLLNKGDTQISIPGGDTYHLTSGICSQVETKDKPLGRFFREESHGIEGTYQAPNSITKKAQIWMGKTGWSWLRKETELSRSEEGANTHQFNWHLWHEDQLNNVICQRSLEDAAFYEQETLTEENPVPAGGRGTSSLLSSFDGNSSNSPNTSCSIVTGEKLVNNSLDHAISWNDLVIGDQIGEGSCGTVHSAKWNESEVAIKVFSRLDYADDIALSFSQEISLMKRLRHPNVLLFMGAVTSGQHLCIVTEYLPRGSLFDLLQKSGSKLDWRRRVSMAMDIARGMNYLHHCKPPIIHRDLKSSNLLVDRNWTVKVGDFGLSRLKLETYLKTKSGKGTPQWMAPEVIRNEPSNEKSDVYSYGVILWELATDKIPWENLNVLQVIAAVGFMDRRLEIPKDVDPEWASIIQCCWNSDLKSRPTFMELLERLKAVQKNCASKARRARSSPGEINHIVNSAR